eukprot:2689609-Pyramimonas_sp.AAC.1
MRLAGPFARCPTFGSRGMASCVWRATDASGGCVCGQVSDEGGGIPRSGLPRIWTYMYSTAKTSVLDEQIDDGSSAELNTPAVLAGYDPRINERHDTFIKLHQAISHQRPSDQ